MLERPLFLVTLVLAGALTLAGCGDGTPESSPTSPPSSSQGTTAGYVAPANLQIPYIGVDSTVVPIQMTKQVLDVAPLDAKPMEAGWFDRSAKPGQIGPLVIAAHVNYNGPGAFGKLHTLKPGAEIMVADKQGRMWTYVATEVRTVSKDKFPTSAVYGRTDKAKIVLITCGGAFSSSRRVGASSGSYVDNIIVIGTLKK